MGTVTYPDNDVAAFVSENFAPLKINVLDRHPDFKEASGATRVIFAPTLLFSDHKGRELRRYLGWLPKVDFLGELQFALGMYEFNRGQFLPARDNFQQGLEAFGDADVSAEALYWHGVAAFLGGNKDGEALKNSWQAVRERFPNSTWATRAEVIDDLPGD